MSSKTFETPSLILQWNFKCVDHTLKYKFVLYDLFDVTEWVRKRTDLESFPWGIRLFTLLLLNYNYLCRCACTCLHVWTCICGINICVILFVEVATRCLCIHLWSSFFETGSFTDLQITNSTKLLGQQAQRFCPGLSRLSHLPHFTKGFIWFEAQQRLGLDRGSSILWPPQPALQLVLNFNLH